MSGMPSGKFRATYPFVLSPSINSGQASSKHINQVSGENGNPHV
jgi:hypothetical protein